MKVESVIVRMMTGYAGSIVTGVGILHEHNNPRQRLESLLYCTRALAKVIEAELVNHPVPQK